ncbi:MAG: adenylate/guanylate cyclase domain-containing protein [Longimicrobiales bacterium]
MALFEDLQHEVRSIFRERWSKRDGRKVPEYSDLTLTNDAMELTATVLYADINDSTDLVDDHPHTFAAEVYKAFLHCAAKIVRAQNGVVTAYDGDRLMAVFRGDSKNTNAAIAGLKLNYARVHIINPELKAQYSDTTYELQHVVGIDTGKLLVARTGVRGANDLVWVGRPANHAAKLCSLSPEYPTRITAEVYESLAKSAKYSSGQPMWESARWTAMGDRQIYRSTWLHG